MPKSIQPLQENKKPFHRRNGSGEIHVFESARYFDSSTTTLAHKQYMREGGGRLSLDIQNTRRNSIPLQAMMMENRKQSNPLQTMVMDQNPMVIKNDKKYKQPSSPGGKLAHFLNSLFNQSSKKSKLKSKSTTPTHSMKDSMKDEDESPSGWRRRRRSSISLFRSGNSNSTSDTKSTCSTKSTTTYKDLKDPRTHFDKTHPCEITKMPMNETLSKNETLMIKSGFSGLKGNSGNGLVEKVRVGDKKHEDHKKCDPTVEIKELKSFILDDYGGDSDSSSDLFELTNCDLGYHSSGLPVFETTHMDSIKRGAPMMSS